MIEERIKTKEKSLSRWKKIAEEKSTELTVYAILELENDLKWLNEFKQFINEHKFSDIANTFMPECYLVNYLITDLIGEEKE